MFTRTESLPPHFNLLAITPQLFALERTRDWQAAALTCALSYEGLQASIAQAETEYGKKLVVPGYPFAGFTASGEQVLEWAHKLTDSVEELKHIFAASRKKAAVGFLIDRRSVSPKRLGLPGPQIEDIDLMTEAALAAPDHGNLHPWRLLTFAPHQRQALARLFMEEKLRRDPLASRADIDRAMEHATRSPVLLAFIVSLQERKNIPFREQWLCAGAAIGNFLNAAHQLGFGGILLSGDRCFDPLLKEALGVGHHEFLAGFISLGSIAMAPPPRRKPPAQRMRSQWESVFPNADVPVPVSGAAEVVSKGTGNPA